MIISVSGDEELITKLRLLNRRAGLREGFRESSKITQKSIRANINNVKGYTRRSVKRRSRALRAKLTVGGGNAYYARWVNFGLSTRNIEPRQYVARGVSGANPYVFLALNQDMGKQIITIF